ncbi:MAG TPA: urea carboxylase, partial [Alcanivorax sp.]|nr:urea carboxylase [Alcanivorax sp.]
MEVRSRVLHLPLAFEDSATLDAVQRYQETIRSDAPWLPNNVEFIRRINGLDSTEQVKDIVFKASYMVLGLGDVYLGAPCAVPVDPRHRLMTSKYNPARTYTAEGTVGIGGVYMCIYGMDSPGGYQLIGRTLPIWN